MMINLITQIFTAKTKKLFGSKTGNQINVIHPYVHHNQWVFDDIDVGLIKEPFVCGADDMLDYLTDNGDSCTLVFSKDEFPDHNFKIYKSKMQGPTGVNYVYNNGIDMMELWLCPALYKYFNDAPDTIYFNVKDIKS